VAWFTDRNSFAVAVVFYGLSTLHSVFLRREGFRRDNHVSYFLLAAAVVFHSGAMLMRGIALKRCPVSNLYEDTVFIGWTVVAAYLTVGYWSRLRFLGAFASPLLFGIGVFAMFPNLDTPGPKYQLDPATISLHATLVLLSYGAFGLSMVAALMYLTQERNLKVHKPNAIFSLLPPIQRLEMVTGRLILAGVILLTIGLSITPILLRQKALREPMAGSFLTDAKVVWAIIVWCLYVFLLIMRWQFAQRGRRLALGAVGTFAFLLLTFWGTHLLSAIHRS
jgi:HemX protein